MELDLLIAGGEIVDGTGKVGYRADLGVCGDRIAAIGDLSAAQMARRIDAAGLVVAPGFIDPHNHANNEAAGGILHIPHADNSLRQGVTTLVGGNCGGSEWPLGEHLAAVEQTPIRQNYGMLMGLGTLRGMAVKEAGRMATPEEIAHMERLVDEGMDDGALGMSNGYFPAYLTTDEIAAVAAAVGRRGGIYTSHIRNEGDTLLGAIEEIIEIGAQGQLPVQVSHIKTYGRRNWFKIDAVLSLMEQARERGVDIMADRYPYVACFTGVSALLPMWMRTEATRRGGMKALREPGFEPEARKWVADQLHLVGGPQNVLFAPLDPRPDIDGKRLSERAQELGCDPVDVAIDLMIEGGVSCIFFTMSEDNIATFYRHPLVMGGSDGHLREYGAGVSHPRNYGTFPRIIGHYGRDRGLLSVEEAVMKCTSMAAERFGLKGRGVLLEGNVADIAVFSWEGIRDRATFEDQHRYPEGIPWVVVNGKVAVAEGETTQELAGRVVRRGE